MQNYIEIIIGPMFSNKSSLLIKRYHKFKIMGKKPIILKYIHDNRYTDIGISTHDKIVQTQDIRIIQSNILSLDPAEFYNHDVVLIDEGQFFLNIVDFAEKFANLGKIIIVAGLDGNFKREKFNNLIDLIPKAEFVKKLHAICEFCKTNKASFTMRTSADLEIEKIGGKELYVPTCRICYHKNLPIK